jgi:hypothetical protein
LPQRLFILIALAAVILLGYNLDSSTVQPAIAQYSDETAGVIVESYCASVQVAEGYYLYYSPTYPNYFCVHPETQSPWPIPGGGAQVPSSCALAPDQRFYCSPYGELTAATLQELYAQGQLPSL